MLAKKSRVDFLDFSIVVNFNNRNGITIYGDAYFETVLPNLSSIETRSGNWGGGFSCDNYEFTDSSPFSIRGGKNELNAHCGIFAMNQCEGLLNESYGFRVVLWGETTS